MLLSYPWITWFWENVQFSFGFLVSKMCKDAIGIAVKDFTSVSNLVYTMRSSGSMRRGYVLVNISKEAVFVHWVKKYIFNPASSATFFLDMLVFMPFKYATLAQWMIIIKPVQLLIVYLLVPLAFYLVHLLDMLFI